MRWYALAAPFDHTWLLWPFHSSLKLLVPLFYSLCRINLCYWDGDNSGQRVSLLSTLTLGLLRQIQRIHHLDRMRSNLPAAPQKSTIFVTSHWTSSTLRGRRLVHRSDFSTARPCCRCSRMCQRISHRRASSYGRACDLYHRMRGTCSRT